MAVVSKEQSGDKMDFGPVGGRIDGKGEIPPIEKATFSQLMERTKLFEPTSLEWAGRLSLCDAIPSHRLFQ
jgi:hypothetical protein